MLISKYVYWAVISFLVILLGMKSIEVFQLETDRDNLKSVIIGMDAIHQKNEQDNIKKVKRFESNLKVASKTLEEKTKLLKEVKDESKGTCEDSYRLLNTSGI